MDLRTFLFGALVFGSAFVVIVFMAPEVLKNEPAGAEAKHTQTAKAEPVPEPPMDENDSDNDARAEEPSMDEAEEAANPFGQD